MPDELEYDQLEINNESIRYTLDQIRSSIGFDIDSPLTEFQRFKEQKQEFIAKFQDFEKWTKRSSELTRTRIAEYIDDLVEVSSIFDMKAADQLIDLRLSWDDAYPPAWYEKGKILFHRYVNSEVEDLEKIIQVFNKTIEMSSEVKEFQELTFWSYSFMGNLYLYRILTGEEAMEKALKNYNQAYRFAQMNEVDVEESFIFENIEILQRILMQQHPLLIVIYDNFGLKLYEYLFQFVEVISQDKRFIPNFTALLSAVDARIDELFRAPIDNSYMQIEHRVMIISTLYNDRAPDNQEKWIKVAMVFSNMQGRQQDGNQISVELFDKIEEFNNLISSDDEVMTYLINFAGKTSDDIYKAIDNKITQVFYDI